MAESAPPPSPRQAMLTQLSGALAALGDKMRAQQQAAIDVCAMGTRAEEIARSTRNLAFDRRLTPEDGLRALSGELDEFAAEMAATAERVQQDSLLGRAVAEALGGHAADLAALAQQRDGAEDPAAIRARLRPLVVTLDALPTRLKASRERTAEVGALAVRAQAAAARAGALAAGGSTGRQDQMLALSRELGSLAADAANVSAQFSADAAMAVRVAEDMAGQAANLSSGRPATGPAAALSRVLSAGHAMAQEAAAAPAASQSWTGTMNWDLGRPRR
ncbi:hypothetical protein ACFQS7_12555 [Dankookia sp. GCM10030260]|uniref:hypothetical protein n=1 Tax=Dankookia sp. GCM10030260 TaxID=3273390 RepID=UPI00360A13AF